MTDGKRKRADIVSVAKAARVSASTVSRYFNHPELLKPTTRKKIEAAVRKQGYIRNRAAQTIHGIRSGTIGVVVPTIDHTIFAEVVQAFSDAVAAEGFTILLASHGYDQQREYEILRKLLEHRVDGIALTGLDHDSAVFQLIDSQQTPAVLMWNYAQSSAHPSIGADNEMAGRLIAQHALAQGHRDIACLLAPGEGNDRAKARSTAILQTLGEAGVQVPEPWQVTTVYSIAASKRAALELFDGPRRPTALICGNDILATGAMHAVARAGLRVPQDVSVYGIGDFKGSSDSEPALTTVRLPARSIGRKAGENLARAIKNPSAPRHGEHCAPQLIVRGSCRTLHRAP
ncbi:LacI family DNA-binding transcriptional regulator [Sulfitobacter sp. S190]|uniref:LacI family DNA-binding transcriptional regulator n=1 Tax=Sulfitobacter sp. S190 TaxID=2867022 RepID=UPI0021A909D4|nr:LacI family DNA-binding transcriptional regulator [Sulfitobacter sp. S190]UWR21152.1 LacI family DNA-binding transcriptional regulator [Sulfitobacter sp. S190]